MKNTNWQSYLKGMWKYVPELYLLIYRIRILRLTILMMFYIIDKIKELQ